MGTKATLIGIAAAAFLFSGCQLTFIEAPSESPRTSSPSTETPEVPAGIVIGSGRVISEEREVHDFDSVRISGSGTLILQQTGSESLVIEAEDNILPLLISEVRDRQLVLGLRPGTSYRASRKVTYRLTMKDLTGIEVSGSGDVQGTGISTDSLTLQGSGSFDMTLAGRANRLQVDISGSGAFQGEALESREATVMISGSGDATVKVADRLDAFVSGSGNVVYIGNPTLTQRVSGSGSVTRRSG
jgi:hypothetical protein